MWTSLVLVKEDYHLDYSDDSHLSNHITEEFECTEIHFSSQVRTILSYFPSLGRAQRKVPSGCLGQVDFSSGQVTFSLTCQLGKASGK